ncbi:MAG: AmmeMemoRadiSam system protein A [Thermodesulfovibrionales bacterium]
MMHPLVVLAKDAVERFVGHREVMELPESLGREFREARHGVFVSLKKRGELRGCIGTFLPMSASVAEETIRNAIAAASEDPRFPPVAEEELGMLTYSVDVLSAPEEVDDIKTLDPKRYGVIVAQGSRKGLLLPDLEGVDTVERQISIAMMKAGITSQEGMKIFRFTVDRYR